LFIVLSDCKSFSIAYDRQGFSSVLIFHHRQPKPKLSKVNAVDVIFYPGFIRSARTEDANWAISTESSASIAESPIWP
jgi:hypothetical protein